MKVTEHKLTNGDFKLDCIASTADVAQAFSLAHNAFAQQMGVAPQRGKTAEQAVKEQLGIKDLDSIVQTQAIEFLVPFALDKRNITPAYPPKPHINGQIKRGQTFSFTLKVRPKPSYELESYDPVTIHMQVPVLDDAAVDAELHHLAENYAVYEPDDPRPIGPDDCFKVAIRATQGGEPLKGLTTDGRTFIMGQNLMPSSFENQMLGMKPGETKTFSFTFDEDRPEEGPERIECTATVLEIQKRVTPEVTDEWVKKNMPFFGTAARLRQACEGKMRQQIDQEYQNAKLNAAAAELAKRFKGHIDDEVYEASRSNLMSRIRADVEQQGMDFQTFVEQQGGEQQFGMMLMMQARTNLVQGYSLDAVYRHEKLQITDEDIDAAAKTLDPQNPARAREGMEQSGQGFTLRELAERYKANRWVLDHATVIEQ